MTDKEENIIDVSDEDLIDKEEWKDNLLKQGKWIRLFWMLAFSFCLLLVNDSSLVNCLIAVPICPDNR